ISSKFLDGYLNSLDPQHMDFFQSDVAEFEQYRTNLNRLTLTRQGVADVKPAYDIFARFLEHRAQHIAYAEALLNKEKFQFISDEQVVLNRHEMPYPKNLDEARTLWRQRL